MIESGIFPPRGARAIEPEPRRLDKRASTLITPAKAGFKGCGSNVVIFASVAYQPYQAYLADLPHQLYIFEMGRIGALFHVRSGRITMAVNGRVQILNETNRRWPNDWRLCFQRVRYIFDDGDLQEGFRFIWRRPDGSLQGARGQAKIPSLRIARLLMAEAEKQGWGHYDADNTDNVFAEAPVVAV